MSSSALSLSLSKKSDLKVKPCGMFLFVTSFWEWWSAFNNEILQTKEQWICWPFWFDVGNVVYVKNALVWWCWISFPPKSKSKSRKVKGTHTDTWMPLHCRPILCDRLFLSFLQSMSLGLCNGFRHVYNSIYISSLQFPLTSNTYFQSFQHFLYSFLYKTQLSYF